MLRLNTGDKLLSAAFQSVSCRTAGFNTLDFGAMGDATLLVCILLMFIGASPASTGGGLKTTTFAVLLLSARAHFFSRSRVEVYRRSITPETVSKSIAILLFSTTFIFIITILLLSTQNIFFYADTVRSRLCIWNCWTLHGDYTQAQSHRRSAPQPSYVYREGGAA